MSLKKQAFEISLVENNVIKLRLTEPWDGQEFCKQQAELLKEKLEEILDKNPNRTFNMIANIKATDKIPVMYPEERKIYQGFLKYTQLEKIAFVSGSTFFQRVAKVVSFTLGKTDTLKFFSEEQDAEKFFGI